MWQSGTQRMCCQVNLGVSQCMNVAVWYTENVLSGESWGFKVYECGSLVHRECYAISLL